MITKPMLAGTLESEEPIQYPVLVTPKLDGIRCLVVNGHAITRKFKAVPNKYIRAKIEHHCPDGFDGEIMCGELEFNKLQSIVMTEEGQPDFEYRVFDYVKDNTSKSYKDRMIDLEVACDTIDQTFIKPIIPINIGDKVTLLQTEKLYLKQGYEGIMIRTPGSPYKCGRATVREGYLLKLKRFKDSEAEITGMEQLKHNSNKAEKDELGHTKRSHKKAGMVLVNKLGAFTVKDVKTHVEFKVSTGMLDKERKDYWEKGPALLGKLIKYKYQQLGPNKKPRFPVFLGFRDERDIS